ncbi:MAG TPA: hypothetical protein VKS79_10195 [Gemmataceae bacterium]|nr:hypothetical protein [Gemmataceae bacterium]
MPTPVEQLLCRIANGAFEPLGRSPGFAEEWLPEAERICRGFGTRPDGVGCPAALFAYPFGAEHVAVVQIADLAEPAGALGFRLLMLPRRLYSNFIADPFHVSEQFPPAWVPRADLPALEWPDEPPPRRTVEQLQKVLQTGGSPTLLGAVQALIDGGRLVFERPAPATQLVRDLWQLLPYSSQAELWLATFAFSNDLGFDVLVVPKSQGLLLDRYITEEQATDYPEGRYELNLQIAIENGQQHAVDKLLARRSSRQTLRLALFLLFGSIALTVVVGLLNRIF